MQGGTQSYGVNILKSLPHNFVLCGLVGTDEASDVLPYLVRVLLVVKYKC